MFISHAGNGCVDQPSTETVNTLPSRSACTLLGNANSSPLTFIDPSPAELGYSLPLQTVYIQSSWLLKKPTALDLHCLPLSMCICAKNLDQLV